MKIVRGDDNDVKICHQLEKRFRYGLIRFFELLLCWPLKGVPMAKSSTC